MKLFTKPLPMVVASLSKPIYRGDATMPTISKVSVVKICEISVFFDGDCSVIVLPISNDWGVFIVTSTTHSPLFSGILPSTKIGRFR